MTSIADLQVLAGIITEAETADKSWKKRFFVIQVDLESQTFTHTHVAADSPKAALAAYFHESDPSIFDGDQLNPGIRPNPGGGWVYQGDESLVLVI